MLQRIQTLYLLFAFLISGVLGFVFPLWEVDEVPFYFMQSSAYAVLIGLLASLLLFSIISFRNRQHQFVANRLSIILNLILLGLFVFRSLNVSGETPNVSEKGIGMFLPIVSIVFLFLANRAIKRDEDLVKSADRLR